MKRNFLLALLIPIPITLLSDYLISHLGGPDPTNLTMLYTSLVGVFLGFLMAEVGSMSFSKAFLKYLLVILYGGATILGIVSLYVPEVANFYNFKALFLDHALIYLLWGGVYLSLPFYKKASLIMSLIPAIFVSLIALLNKQTGLNASTTTLVRYILYILISASGILVLKGLYGKLSIVIPLLYILVFLAFIVGPLFTIYPDVLTNYISSTYDLWAILAGMSAYGLSNH